MKRKTFFKSLLCLPAIVKGFFSLKEIEPSFAIVDEYHQHTGERFQIQLIKDGEIIDITNESLANLPICIDNPNNDFDLLEGCKSYTINAEYDSVEDVLYLN